MADAKSFVRCRRDGESYALLQGIGVRFCEGLLKKQQIPIGKDRPKAAFPF